MRLFGYVFLIFREIGIILKVSRNLLLLSATALIGVLILSSQILPISNASSQSFVVCSVTETGEIRIVSSGCTDGEIDVTSDLIGSKETFGVNGKDGQDGADGANGSNGIDGKDGVMGRDGSNGATGAAGATGPAGETGATGAAGATGATGATGPAGLDGSAANVGATGPAGPAGPAGTSSGSGVLFTPMDLVPTGWSVIRSDVLLSQVIVEGYYKSVVVLKKGNSNPLLSMYVPEMSDWTNATGIKVTAYMTASASGNAKFEIGAKGYALNESLLDPGWNINHLVSLTPGQVSKVTRTMSNADGLFNVSDDEFYEFGFARRAGDAEDVNTGDVYILGIIIEPTF